MSEQIKYNITCTPLAILKIKEQIVKRNKPGTMGIRFGLRAGKCNGFEIIFEFLDEAKNTDHKFEFDGVSIYIDPKSIIYLHNTEIDYEKKMINMGFIFHVPSQKDSCSCGSSISF